MGFIVGCAGRLCQMKAIHVQCKHIGLYRGVSLYPRAGDSIVENARGSARRVARMTIGDRTGQTPPAAAGRRCAVVFSEFAARFDRAYDLSDAELAQALGNDRRRDAGIGRSNHVAALGARRTRSSRLGASP